MSFSTSEHIQTVLKKSLLAGGAILRRGFRRFGKVRFKTPTSPVTKIDRDSERAILKIIRHAFPSHTFLAEESAYLRRGDLGPSRPDRYRWIIDPLDGTVNYVHGIEQSAVSIAVERGGVILAGGVYDPFREELFLARRGKGATLNGQRLRVSTQPTLSKSILITGFPYNRKKIAGPILKMVGRVIRKGIDIRRFGAAAQDLAWIAAGRAEGYWELNLNPWDVAAGKLLVEEAGGIITDFKGKPFLIDNPMQTLASNGLIHSSLVRLFR